MLSRFTVSLLTASVLAAEPNPPTWDTNHVKILYPGDPTAQATIDTILA